jgi:hypothetical protein
MSIDAMYDLMSGRRQWSDLEPEELRDLERMSPQSSSPLAGNYGGGGQNLPTQVSTVAPIVQAGSELKNPNDLPQYDPATAPNPILELNKRPIEVQPENVITPDIKSPFHFDQGASSLPGTKNILQENGNPTLDYLKSNINSSAENLRESGETARNLAKQSADLATKVANIKNPNFDSSDIDSEIQRNLSQFGNIQDPQRDKMTQAILSLAPGLLGSMTGESGALAAPKAQAAAQSQYENIRKEDIIHNERLRDNLSKRIDALAKMKEQNINLWEKEGKIGVDVVKNQLQAFKDANEAAHKNNEIDQKTYASNLEVASGLDGKLGSAAITSEGLSNKMGIYSDIQQKKMDDIDYRTIMNKIDKDTVLKQYRANSGNLKQVLSKIDDPNIMKNPQSLSDFQQLLSSSMGIKPGSMNERDMLNIVKGFGIDATNLKSYFETKPEEVDQKTRESMGNYFRNLAHNEKFTTNLIAKQTMDAISSGYEDMMERRPEYASGVKNKITSYMKLFNQDVPTPPKSIYKGTKTSNISPSGGPSREEMIKHLKILGIGE